MHGHDGGGSTRAIAIATVLLAGALIAPVARAQPDVRPVDEDGHPELPPPEVTPPEVTPPEVTPPEVLPPPDELAGDDADLGPPSDQGASGQGEFESPDADDPDRMRMLVIDAATFGIDPVVGRVASAQMRETGTDLGYEVLDQADTIAAAQQLTMPYPPTPADLWRVSWVARVHRGAFARIWAHAGQYVIEITVASLDGAGPFYARGASGADDLRETVDRLLRTALPLPHVWNEASGDAGTPSATEPTDGAGEPTSELDDPSGGSPGRRGATSEPEPELRRWSLTVQTEAVFGASQDFFYNHLIGVRLDFRITSTILLGAYVAYANLNARNDRAHNLLVMLQFENRIRISNDIDLTIPLRGAIGYLPFNGPVIRLAAGLNYAFTPDFEMGIDLLTPTFWILPDRTAVSLDVAVEGTLRF
ncbi:MAG: hypothetical protein AB7S26_21560 [Sandaracinaceae bacterium]